MGEAELHTDSGTLFIRSVFFFYGDAAGPDLSRQIADDIGRHWNEPQALAYIHNTPYRVVFDIDGIYEPGLDPEKVWYNDNPRFNFFRVETFAAGNISFVDGQGSNTGYFKLGDLLQTSTTAAHEYGHTLGLEHPVHPDIRGGLPPGIMYPRGTLCDPPLQYDPHARPGEKGGTLNPMHRKVLTTDIEALHLPRLHFNRHGLAILGDFSSLYHEKHTPTVT